MSKLTMLLGVIVLLFVGSAQAVLTLPAEVRTAEGYPFGYCDKGMVSDNYCDVIETSKDGVHVLFWSQGGTSCPNGYYGYINIKTRKGYMLSTSPQMCSDDKYTPQFFIDRGTKEWVIGTVVNNKLIAVDHLK